mgnify:CR=1 FL=1|jgi:hypothetical protein
MVVAEGTPEQVMRSEISHTGMVLREKYGENRISPQIC